MLAGGGGDGPTVTMTAVDGSTLVSPEVAPPVLLDASPVVTADAAASVAVDASDAAAGPRCPLSQHVCGNACVSDNDVRTCGTSCSPCAVPTIGTATCDGRNCGVSCPAGTSECVVGDCTPLMSSAEHCGRCNNPCPAGCAGGSCRCVNPSAANLIVNAGFARTASGWREPYEVTLAWTGEDVAGCADSGAIMVTNTHPALNVIGSTEQCFPVKAGTTYNFGGWLKQRIPQRQGEYEAGVIGIWWKSDANCDSDDLPQVQALGVTADSGWTHIAGSEVAPAGAVAVAFYLGVIGPFSVPFDMLYFTPAPGRF